MLSIEKEQYSSVSQKVALLKPYLPTTALDTQVILNSTQQPTVVFKSIFKAIFSSENVKITKFTVLSEWTFAEVHDDTFTVKLIITHPCQRYTRPHIDANFQEAVNDIPVQVRPRHRGQLFSQCDTTHNIINS